MVRGTIPRQPSKFGRQAGVQQRGKVAAGAGRIAVTPAKAKTSAPKPASVRPALKQPAAPVVAKAKSPKGKAPAYDPLAPERIRGLLARLDATYPRAVCALHHSSAWELLVATILSAQCTDVRVNQVTPALFRLYPTPQAFAAVEPEQLEEAVRSTGFFRNKAKSLVGAARKLIADFGGQVPDDMAKLLTLPGVARKTANVVLGSWFGKAEGVVVDTHVQRISRRLELTTNEEPGKIEQDLMRVIPRERWIGFSHQVIHHGRALCVARKPKCADCPLEKLCHAGDKTWSTVPMNPAAQ